MKVTKVSGGKFTVNCAKFNTEKQALICPRYVCESYRWLFIWNKRGRCYQNKDVIDTAGWFKVVSAAPKLFTQC